MELELETLFYSPEGKTTTKAVDAFMAGELAEVNTYLRQGVGSTDRIKEALELDAFLAGQELKENIQLYKGMVDLTKKNFDNLVETMKPGTVFKDLGFISTTTRKPSLLESESDGGSVALRILSKKGSTASYLPTFDKTLDQTEVLLPRSTQFRVLNTSLKEDKLLAVDLEIFNG